MKHCPSVSCSFLVAVATGVVLDLVAEWRARCEHADLVAVWPIHRVYALEPALAALAAADIPVFPRGARHRTLLQFFGPFIPIDLMVPRDRAAEAERVLASWSATAG